MRTGGRLLIDCLMALGATKCFGVPGESALAVLHALHETAGRLDFRLGRNESGAVLDLVISPEALTPRQTLPEMRDAALASQKATA